MQKKDLSIEQIIQEASLLEANTDLLVENFGKDKNLTLKIYKDILFDGTPETNQVTLHLSKDGIYLDNSWFLDVTKLNPILEQYYETPSFDLQRDDSYSDFSQELSQKLTF